MAMVGLVLLVEAAQGQANGTKLRADFARVAVARKIVTLVYYGLRDGTIRSKATSEAASRGNDTPRRVVAACHGPRSNGVAG